MRFVTAKGLEIHGTTPDAPLVLMKDGSDVGLLKGEPVVGSSSPAGRRANGGVSSREDPIEAPTPHLPFIDKVMKEGHTSGIEHMTLTGSHTPMRTTDNSPDTVNLSADMIDQLLKTPGGVATHNHPSSSPISGGDVGFAAAWPELIGSGAIAHNGNVSGLQMTPEMHQAISAAGLDREQAHALFSNKRENKGPLGLVPTIRRQFDRGHVPNSVRDKLDAAYRAAPDKAAFGVAYHDLVMRGLAKAGVMDYHTSYDVSVVPQEAQDALIGYVAGFAKKFLTKRGVNLEPASGQDPDSLFTRGGSTRVVQPGERLESLLGAGKSAAQVGSPGRRDSGSGGHSSPAGEERGKPIRPETTGFGRGLTDRVGPGAEAGLATENGRTVLDLQKAAIGLSEGIEEPFQGRFMRGTRKPSDVQAADVVARELKNDIILPKDGVGTITEAVLKANGLRYLTPIVQHKVAVPRYAIVALALRRSNRHLQRQLGYL